MCPPTLSVLRPNGLVDLSKRLHQTSERPLGRASRHLQQFADVTPRGFAGVEEFLGVVVVDNLGKLAPRSRRLRAQRTSTFNYVISLTTGKLHRVGEVSSNGGFFGAGRSTREASIIPP